MQIGEITVDGRVIGSVSLMAGPQPDIFVSEAPGAPPAQEITISMDETRAQGGISWSYYRLADANNGVTGEEQQAISAYPFWQRFTGPAISAKALIALPDQPVAY